MWCSWLTNIFDWCFFFTAVFLLVLANDACASLTEQLDLKNLPSQVALTETVCSYSEEDPTQLKTLKIRKIIASIENACLSQKSFDKGCFDELQMVLENILRDTVLWLEQSKSIKNKNSFSNLVKANVCHLAKLVGANNLQKSRPEVFGLCKELQKIFEWDIYSCGKILKYMDSIKFWTNIKKIEENVFKCGKILGAVFGFMKLLSMYRKNFSFKAIGNDALQARVKDLEKTVEVLVKEKDERRNLCEKMPNLLSAEKEALSTRVKQDIMLCKVESSRIVSAEEEALLKRAEVLVREKDERHSLCNVMPKLLTAEDEALLKRARYMMRDGSDLPA